MIRALAVIDTIADRVRRKLTSGIAMGINLGLPGLASLDLRSLCVLVVTHNQGLMNVQQPDGSWAPETTDAWAARMIEHGDALYRALRKEGVE